MQIALFGGSFDPPHQAHQTIAAQLLHQKLVDQVWFVPVQKHPFGKVASADQHRLAMLKLVLQTTELREFAAAGRVRVEEFELQRSQDQTSYSIDTLRYFARTSPKDHFSWVIGSDNLASFSKWHAANELLTEYGVWVYPRQGHPMTPLLPGMQLIEGVAPLTESSTEARAKVQAGLSLTGLVDPAIVQYISKHQLYAHT